MRRAAIVRTTTATIALRAAATATPVRPRALPTRNLATNGRTRRAAKVFARMATGRRESARTVRDRPAMAIGPSGNSAATRNSRAARRIVVAATASATPAIVARAGNSATTAAAKSHGRSARIIVRRAMAGAISTNRAPTSPVTTGRVTTAAATTSVRGFRGRARIVRNSIVHARGTTPGRSIHAAKGDRPIVIPTARAATMKKTARYSPSARPSADVAPIASAIRKSAVRRGRHAPKNPASASPR